VAGEIDPGTFFCNGCGAQPMLMVAQARHAVGLASVFVISFILSLSMDRYCPFHLVETVQNRSESWF
jgi:hypothetical protein